MPGYVGMQLALELSNVLPIKEVVVAGYNKILNMARELRNSGSDIVVEEDLAEIFAAVQVQKFTPLYSGSEIELHEGPGPTMLRAFHDSRYLSTVLTLSMLGYFHGMQELASMLAFVMEKRCEAKVPGASNSPGFDSLAGTLAACSTQASEFNWWQYRERIEVEFQRSIPNYTYSPDYFRLPSTVLLGAIDFLYVVQSLPEDRRITISSQIGCIPLIIWAHDILGLTVAVTGLPVENVVFGDAAEAHIYITWSQESKEEKNTFCWPMESQDPDPVVRLLEKDTSVIISCEPQEDDTLSARAMERHPLRSYGTTYLRRILNINTITEDEDLIYIELVAFIVGLALHASQRMQRELDSDSSGNDQSRLLSGGQDIVLEAWRIKRSAEIFFDGIPVRFDKCSSYRDFFLTTTFGSLDDSVLPLTFAKLQEGSSSMLRSKRLTFQVEQLAKLMLIFAHIIELKECGEMPLIFTDDHFILSHFMSQISWASDTYGRINPEDIFHAISVLLCDEFNNREDTAKFSSRGHFLFLASDFGWSVYLSTVDNVDPAQVRPELLHVRKGTPLDTRTKERKLRIRDGIGFRRVEYPEIYPFERGSKYTPRTVASLLRRKEYWASRLQEFELTIHNTFQISPELQNHGAPKETDVILGYRKMQCDLWETFLTPECEHSSISTEKGESPKDVTIGTDVAVLLGWTSAFEAFTEYSERIIILLTRGEHNVRWLVVVDTTIGNFDPCYKKRMIRTEKCCDSCAVLHLASLEGRWTLIL